MGRGLSDLQKQILVMAYQGKLASRNGQLAVPGQGEAGQARKIIRELYGLPEHRPAYWMFWDYSKVSRNEVNARKVSVSRALSRLLKRKLLAGNWDEYKLTDEGIRLAQGLSGPIG